MTRTQADHATELGVRIRAVRGGRGRSLRSVATVAGVSESFLSQVERGVASPSVATLRRIAEALGSSEPPSSRVRPSAASSCASASAGA